MSRVAGPIRLRPLLSGGWFVGRDPPTIGTYTRTANLPQYLKRKRYAEASAYGSRRARPDCRHDPSGSRWWSRQGHRGYRCQSRVFNTLVAAVQAAGLEETLRSEGPFTVFAPTDEAFAALPEGTVENLLKPENRDQLVAVLTYHVLSGKVMSSDIAGKMLEPETVQGSTVKVDATDGVKVDGANVVSADIEATNGVIHVIDAVILP